MGLEAEIQRKIFLTRIGNLIEEHEGLKRRPKEPSKPKRSRQHKRQPALVTHSEAVFHQPHIRSFSNPEHYTDESFHHPSRVHARRRYHSGPVAPPNRRPIIQPGRDHRELSPPGSHSSSGGRSPTGRSAPGSSRSPTGKAAPGSRSPPGSSKRRREDNWNYRPSNASHSLPASRRRRSPRQMPPSNTAYSTSPCVRRSRHLALRVTPRSTTKPVIDPNHHLLSNMPPHERSDPSHAYSRTRVISPTRPASSPSSPHRQRDEHIGPRQQPRPQSAPLPGRHPVISATRNPFPEIKKPRPYAISMKATLVDHPKKKKSHDKDPKITIINLEKSTKHLERKDASLPESWFGKQGKGVANSSQTSLLSFASNSRSSVSDPSSAMDSGSSGLSRSLENSVSTIATIIEEESMYSMTDPEASAKICGALRNQHIGGGYFEDDDEPSSKRKNDCDFSTEQSDQLTFPSSNDELELNSVTITVQRPKNAEEAFLEFSNAIAICVCSLQLGYEYLELLYQLSDRLYGREQVNYDLSQGSITRNLTSNYEFMQLLNLLGFELEDKMLICRQKPPEQVLKVFQKYIREYQYAGFETYSTAKYTDLLDENALKMLQIVMAVTHDNAQTNEDLTRSFVAFMPYLCDVNTMLELLQFWYEQCVSHFENSSNVKSAIATLLKHLIAHYKYEVFASSVYQSLVDKIEEDDPVGYTHIEAVIREANSNVQTLPFLLQNTISTVSNLLDLSPQTLADNLTLSNFNLFTSIPLVDFFEQNLTTSKVAEFMTRYENIQRWVMITLYSATSAEDRGSRIRTFFKVAERMKENQDFFGFFAMFRALQSPEIQSFSDAWRQVFVKKFRSKRDYSKIWMEWKAICTKAGKGTELFWKSRPPAIPSFHVISAHMDWIPRYQENSRDAVELFCQLRKLYPFVKKLQNYQKMHFSLKADISVINALEAEFLTQSKMNLWSVRSLYIKALNADSIPIPSDILTKMNRPGKSLVSPRRKRDSQLQVA